MSNTQQCGDCQWTLQVAQKKKSSIRYVSNTHQRAKMRDERKQMKVYEEES